MGEIKKYKLVLFLVGSVLLISFTFYAYQIIYIPGPCRTSGSCPACRSRLPGASDKCTLSMPAASLGWPGGERELGRMALALSSPYQPGTFGGNARCKSTRSCRPARHGGQSLHRRSCRKSGRLPSRIPPFRLPALPAGGNAVQPTLNTKGTTRTVSMRRNWPQPL